MVPNILSDLSKKHLQRTSRVKRGSEGVVFSVIRSLPVEQLEYMKEKRQEGQGEMYIRQRRVQTGQNRVKIAVL